MVRNYKSKKASFNKDKLAAALFEVKNNKTSIKAAAKMHGVARSTLSDWLKRNPINEDGELITPNAGHKTVKG